MYNIDLTPRIPIARFLEKNVLSLPPWALGGAMLQSAAKPAGKEPTPGNGIIVGASYHNDTSPPLREIKQQPLQPRPEREANENPKVPKHHRDSPDQTAQTAPAAPSMPGTILNFDGIPFPGVACNCAPPDTNGEVGATQYVQIVKEGYQVFDKNTGASVLGPSGIATIWTGFGGVCETAGDGDPVVLAVNRSPSTTSAAILRWRSRETMSRSRSAFPSPSPSTARVTTPRTSARTVSSISRPPTIPGPMIPSRARPRPTRRSTPSGTTSTWTLHPRRGRS